MEKKIIVVGAGITGLALARAFEQAELKYVLVERRASAADSGLAINLPGNAIEALNRLGLADEIKRLGRPVRRREYRTSSGRLMFHVDEDAFWGSDMRPHAIMRSDLLHILSSRLPAHSIIRGCGVDEVETKDEHLVAILEDKRTLRADLVIGADGFNSRTRQQILPEDGRQVSRIGESSWRFMVPNPGVDYWTVFASKDAVCLLMPVNEAETYGWAMTHPSATDAGVRVFESAFTTFPTVVRKAVSSALEEPARIIHSPLLDVRPSRWSAGRIVIAGDAAHAMAPIWAQGAALGLEDALVLSEELTSHSDWIVAVQKYEARRRPRVAHVQAATDSMSRAARLPQWLRTLAMPIIGPRRYSSTYSPLKARP